MQLLRRLPEAERVQARFDPNEGIEMLLPLERSSGLSGQQEASKSPLRHASFTHRYLPCSTLRAST